MPKIFVCHRRADAADVAGRIYDRLVRKYGGQQILKDLDSIPLGVDFREYLGRMVGECDVFLVVIGPRWLDAEGDTLRLADPRDFVRIEIESALGRNIPVVPLFIGGASMPSEEDVPESIRSFVYRNGVSVRPDPDFHRDMDRVIAGLDGHGPPALSSAETAAPSQPEPIRPADHDRHRDAERKDVRTDAGGTLADELAAAQQRHYAELARLEAESAATDAAAPVDVRAAAEALAADTLAAERGRVRAEAALTTVAARLATAEERDHAEIDRLETEEATSRNTAPRDVQARADAQADDRLIAELNRARADAARTLAAELAAAEERHRADIARIEAEATGQAKSSSPRLKTDHTVLQPVTGDPTAGVQSVDRLIEERGDPRVREGEWLLRDDPGGDLTGIPTLATAEQAPTILIVGEDEVQTMTGEPGFETNIRAFADTDAIRALQCISRDRPRVVVLERAFVSSSRGALLVDAIKTDPTLADIQIRVISRASDYLSLIRGTDPHAASDDAMPGEPLPEDYLGTRGARRYKLRPGVEARVDGNPTTLVDLSVTGARLVGVTVLRLKQRVRFVMGTAPQVVRGSGTVVWVSFEPRGKGAPRYRAGVQFIDADPAAIDDLVLRHLRD